MSQPHVITFTPIPQAVTPTTYPVVAKPMTPQPIVFPVAPRPTTFPVNVQPVTSPVITKPIILPVSVQPVTKPASPVIAKPTILPISTQQARDDFKERGIFILDKVAYWYLCEVGIRASEIKEENIERWREYFKEGDDRKEYYAREEKNIESRTKFIDYLLNDAFQNGYEVIGTITNIDGEEEKVRAVSKADIEEHNIYDWKIIYRGAPKELLDRDVERTIPYKTVILRLRDEVTRTFVNVDVNKRSIRKYTRAGENKDIIISADIKGSALTMEDIANATCALINQAGRSNSQGKGYRIIQEDANTLILEPSISFLKTLYIY